MTSWVEGRLSDFLGDPRRRSSLLEAGLLDFLGQEPPTSHVGANELVLRSTLTWAFQQPVGPVSPWAARPPGDCTHEIGYQRAGKHLRLFLPQPGLAGICTVGCVRKGVESDHQGGHLLTMREERSPRGQTVKRLAGLEGTACKAATGSL